MFISKDEKENGVFSAYDEKIKNEVMEITNKLHSLNSFVDTKNYSIKCNVCYKLLMGNQDAVSHSKATGHINFVQL